MVDQRSDRTRRNLMRVVVQGILQGISAGFLAGISQAEASDKMTLQQAEYQASPNGIYSCGMCTLFEPPKSCKVVEGDVSRSGWCKVFELAD